VSARLPDSRVFPHCGIDRKQHYKSRIANANERGVQAKERLDTSNERSLLGTSLAAETSFQQFFWNQEYNPGFLESVEAAETSVCATKYFGLTLMGPTPGSSARCPLA